jgi:hypothetical protein
MKDFGLSQLAIQELEKNLDKPSFFAIQYFNHIHCNSEQKNLIIYILTQKLRFIRGDKNAEIYGLRKAFGLVDEEQNSLYEELLSFVIKNILILSKLEKKSISQLVFQTVNYLCKYYYNYVEHMKNFVLDIV